MEVSDARHTPAMRAIAHAVQNENLGFLLDPTMLLYIRHWREGHILYLIPRKVFEQGEK